MNTKDDGGPAFPTGTLSQNSTTGETVIQQYLSDGMTLRDYFAAKAMQGYLANPGDGFSTIKESADFCYAWADAMLKARES